MKSETVNSIGELRSIDSLELKFDENPGDFSIISRVYERELDDKYEIILQNLKNGETTPFQRTLEENVFFKQEDKHFPKDIENRILIKYEKIPKFCSAIINERIDLSNHIKNIYEISYLHYAWAKVNNLDGGFPNYSCESSSINLFLTLMEKGYPNSSIFCSGNDHAYVALPFLFGKKRKQGFIIIDPTSDQLFKDKENAPRNNLFVVWGKNWKYITDWENGANLYPDPEYSRFANLDTLSGQQKLTRINMQFGLNKYFRKVFENPVDIVVNF